MADIQVVLPLREGFGLSHFGAIALCVRDFTEYSKYRNDTHIFGGVDTEPFTNMPYEVVRYLKIPFRSQNKAYAKAIVKRLKVNSPKLLEVHNRPILVHHISKQWQGTIALHLHNDPQTMRYAKTAKERDVLLEKCSAIYCVSEYIRDRFLDGTNGDSSKVHVIYNGLHEISSPPNKQKHILFVGRFQPEKGALDIAQALETVLPEFPDWKGIFIGAARHDPNAKINDYERKVINALKSVDSQIEMRGFCSHGETMDATLEAAIAVIPSQWNEAFGRTGLEAMACGCATISSVRGGLKEVVADAAYPLEIVLPETIVSALREVITNEEKRKALQKAGLERAKYFAIERVTGMLDDVRSTLLGS
ncbi:MAG: glycosyltransferase family 4 protein [Rickettsiales bacterium]|nr:glycosyltransferase family 4 protein [Rickettsiales bacterium]